MASQVESPTPSWPGAPPAIRARPRSSASGTCSRFSQPCHAMAGGTSELHASAPPPGGNEPKVQDTSCSSTPNMASTASASACRAASGADAAAWPSSDSSAWLKPVAPEGPVLEATLHEISNSSWLTLPSCANTAFLAWPKVKRLTWPNVASRSHSSFGYISCFSTYIACPSIDFSRACASPFIRSCACANASRSICGARTSQ
mmetsp:Transcript_44786/g.124118  ORF Transcript_44786/g.124118 Transcript_44786/m.124118 type:complete len:203 (-) Transcript_44786:101-709(-)